MSENDLVYPGGKLRLYLDAPLGAALRVVPGEKQAHYLLHVMRAKVGDRIGVFNGRDDRTCRGHFQTRMHASLRSTDVDAN